MDERMSIRNASRAVRQVGLVTRQFAAMSGCRRICEKPRIKCSECPHQRFLRITDEIIRWHLCGHDDKGREFVMGVYPMPRDETCFFLAADFDKATWQQDAGAFLETCQQMNVPAALERSRSGAGAE